MLYSASSEAFEAAETQDLPPQEPLTEDPDAEASSSNAEEQASAEDPEAEGAEEQATE